MKKLFIYLCLLLISSPNAQNIFSPIVNDFVVSDDNNPSTFLQEKTKLFANGTNGGIYTWWDYRFGEPICFAQKFNNNGLKVGSNFNIMDDLDLCFAPDNSFLVLGEVQYSSAFSGGWDGRYSVQGKIYFENGDFIPEFNIAFGSVPWCGTGWLGLHHALSRTNNNYIYFHSSGGPVTFFKLNFNGELVFQRSTSQGLPDNAYDIICVSNEYNEYALFFLQAPSYNLSGGIYATIFAANDSIISKNILIKPLSYNFGSRESDNLRAVVIKDSIYQLFWASEQLLKLSYWNINRNGTQISPQVPISLFNSGVNSSNIYRSITNMGLTPINNGAYSILVTVRESQYPLTKDYNTLINFNQQGIITGIVTDSSNTFDFGRQLFKLTNHQLLVPASINNDSYQKRLTNLVVSDSLILNDDLVGSNETLPWVHRINDNESFISYNDENNLLGKKINNNGIILTNEIILENRNLRFYEDGWAVAHWYEQDPFSNNRRVGISIYDQNFILNKKIPLNSFQKFNNHIDCQILSDSNIVVAFFRSDSLFLRLYNRYGVYIKEKLITTSLQRNPISIFIENQNSFLLTTYYHTQLFDNHLVPLSGIFNQRPYHYLGNLKMLSTSTNTNNQVVGQITDLNGNLLSNKFFLCNSSRDFFMKRLSNEKFSIVFNYLNKIYVKSFSSNGVNLIDSLLIHLDSPGFRKTPHFNISNNRVIFTWADARNPVKGYDIYCSIMNISDLVRVDSKNERISPKEFKLFQNYPNPFNPATRIQYQVSSSSHVTLKVYDMLGNEVATSVDEYKPVGSYEVEFSASSGIRYLASGIYFYQLKAGDFVQTKKMILIR